MKTFSIRFRSFLLILLTLLPAVVFGQENALNQEFKPHVGQEGKDVIWVPTPNELVNKMLEIGKVTDKDILIDLGSGDGRTVIAAAKIGAKALGIEYNPDMVALSEKNAKEAGVSDLAKFIKADLFGYDLSEATVITMFLLPEINLKLRPRLLDLKPGTRIVSNTFTMGDWEPDMEVTTEENWNSWYTALMWVVPAKVSGIWDLDGNTLEITQQFQMIYGSFNSENSKIKITDGRLDGNNITFTVGTSKYTGQVEGNKKMSGTVTSGSGSKEWVASPKSESK
jgi:precorrin-6B methylase 2